MSPVGIRKLETQRTSLREVVGFRSAIGINFGALEL
jgi:hypothetical protein